MLKPNSVFLKLFTIRTSCKNCPLTKEDFISGVLGY